MREKLTMHIIIKFDKIKNGAGLGGGGNLESKFAKKLIVIYWMVLM